MGWISEHAEQLFTDFMSNKPDYSNLIFIHKWYDFDRFKKEQKDLDPNKVNKITLFKFKTALLNYAEKKLVSHRNSIRGKLVDEINTRIQKSNYVDKLNYLDFQIETAMREIN